MLTSVPPDGECPAFTYLYILYIPSKPGAFVLYHASHSVTLIRVSKMFLL